VFLGKSIFQNIGSQLVEFCISTGDNVLLLHVVVFDLIEKFSSFISRLNLGLVEQVFHFAQSRVVSVKFSNVVILERHISQLEYWWFGSQSLDWVVFLKKDFFHVSLVGILHLVDIVQLTKANFDMRTVYHVTWVAVSSTGRGASVDGSQSTDGGVFDQLVVVEHGSTFAGF
jgi:hypothetical protein